MELDHNQVAAIALVVGWFLGLLTEHFLRPVAIIIHERKHRGR